jgi:CBS domain containing-hemolysin-like protein
MSHTDPTADQGARGASRTTTAWGVVAVLLGIGIVLPLLVGLYDSEKPALFGFPFFFWFQFLLIPVVSVLTYTSFRIAQTATARDRERQGLPRHADGNGDLR